MENILQLNSNTFFIDRRADDFAIIENFLLKKASSNNIKDVEEVEIIISSDYSYDIEFKTREGSIRVKEAAGIGKAIFDAGKTGLKGFFMGNHAPGTPMYDRIASNPLGKLLGSGNGLTGLLGAAAGFATGGIPGALAGYIGGSGSGLLGLALNAGLAASGVGGIGLLVAASLSAMASGSLRERNKEIPNENRAKYTQAIESGVTEEEARKLYPFKRTPEEEQADTNKAYNKYVTQSQNKTLGIEDKYLNTPLSAVDKAKLYEMRQQGATEDKIEVTRRQMIDAKLEKQKNQPTNNERQDNKKTTSNNGYGYNLNSSNVYTNNTGPYGYSNPIENKKEEIKPKEKKDPYSEFRGINSLNDIKKKYESPRFQPGVGGGISKYVPGKKLR